MSNDKAKTGASHDAAPVVAARPSDASTEEPAGDEGSSSDRRAAKRHRKDAHKDPGGVSDPDRSASVDGGTTGASSKRENSPLPPSDGSAAPSPDAAKNSSADCALPEKDMARESWRRNWPAVCVLAGTGKAFILIPIKGPLEGETHALHRRPTREARISLPQGTESQLTLKQYKVNRLGFKEVRVNTTDGAGTRLKVKLQPGAGDPVFEVKDGYAKVTVAVPEKN